MVIDLNPREEPDPLDIFDQNCILILEQNREYVDYLSTVFQQQNFKVLSHTSGELGLQTATKSIPDCILINSRLLDMDGVTICQKIVDQSTTCGIPVIMMGKSETADEIKQAKAAGCEFYVSKPVDPRALVFLVNESIAQARSWICE